MNTIENTSKKRVELLNKEKRLPIPLASRKEKEEEASSPGGHTHKMT